MTSSLAAAHIKNSSWRDSRWGSVQTLPHFFMDWYTHWQCCVCINTTVYSSPLICVIQFFCRRLFMGPRTAWVKSPPPLGVSNVVIEKATIVFNFIDQSGLVRHIYNKAGFFWNANWQSKVSAWLLLGWAVNIELCVLYTIFSWGKFVTLRLSSRYK